jgi:hypothetical protein
VGAGETGGVEPDAGAAPDYQDGLAEQVGCWLWGWGGGRGGHVVGAHAAFLS